MDDHLKLVRRVAASLGDAHTVEAAAAAILDAVGAELLAVTSSVWLVDTDADVLRLTYERNADPEAVAVFAEVPLAADLPGPVVVKSGEPLFMASRDERAAQWPSLANVPSPSDAMVVLPLSVMSERLGVISFGFATARTFERDDREALLAVADQCAIALDRARLYDAERHRAAVGETVADIASGQGDVEDWTELAWHAVQATTATMADTCGVYIREGNLIRRVAITSRRYGHVEELIDQFPTPLNADVPLAEAVRTEVPVHLPAITPGLLREVLPLPVAERFDDVRLGAGCVIPLGDGRSTFGAMLFASPPDTAPIPDIERAWEQIAHATSALLRSAARFEDQRATIAALHDSVLPNEPAAVGPFEVSCCYVPVTRHGIVGGDWWDAFELPGDQLAFAVGDVAGHGVAAVPLMGQLRNALRAMLVEDGEPASALRRLSAFLDWTEPDAHCSAVVATVDATTGVARWADAAHPPPLLIDASGSAAYLDTATGPPVGVRLEDDADPYTTRHVELPVGAALLLYTDGLVEDRTRPIDEGLLALEAAARRHLAPDEPLQVACERIVAELVDQPHDDVCLLIARRVR